MRVVRILGVRGEIESQSGEEKEEESRRGEKKEGEF